MADYTAKIFDWSLGIHNARVNPLMYPETAIFDGENVDLFNRGLRTRPGYSIVSTFGAGATVDFIGQVRFPTNEKTVLIAQVRTATTCKLYASNTALPSDTLTWTEIYNLGLTAGMITVANLNDRAIITEGIAQPPLVFSGGFDTEGADWAVPKQVLAANDGVSFYDAGLYLCDSDASTVLDLSSFPAVGSLLFCFEVPITTGIYLQVGTANTTTATMSVMRYTSGAWASVSVTDNTSVGGKSLARSGTITWTSTSSDYQSIAYLPGYWYMISWNATLSSGTSLAKSLFQAPCQPLQNIGDGMTVGPLGFLFNDVSTGAIQDYTVQTQDFDPNTVAAFNDGNLAAPVGWGTGDALYIGSLSKFTGMIPIIQATSNNIVAATLSAYYWNGSGWTAVTHLIDGTFNNTATFNKSGMITWQLPTNWKQNIPLGGTAWAVGTTYGLGAQVNYGGHAYQSLAAGNVGNEPDITPLSWLDLGQGSLSSQMGYWMKFTVSASLTPLMFWTECQLQPVPESLKKYKRCSTISGRVALTNRSDATDQMDISGLLQEYVWTGSDTWSYRIGGQDQITTAYEIYNQIWASKTDAWFMINGNTPATFSAERAETANQTPVNQECIVAAPVQSTLLDTSRQGLYFVNHAGAWVFTGLQVVKLSDSVDWWDAMASNPKLDLDHLSLCSGIYWAERNSILWSVPMITGTGTSQTTCNRVIQYDLTGGGKDNPQLVGTWQTPWTWAFSAMCAARTADTNTLGGIGKQAYYAADYSGNIVELFDDTTDGGVTIAAWMSSGWLAFNEPSIQKLLSRAILYGTTAGSSIVLSVYKDGIEAAISSETTTSLSSLVGKEFDVKARFGSDRWGRGIMFKYRLDWTDATSIYGLLLGMEVDADLAQ